MIEDPIVKRVKEVIEHGVQARGQVEFIDCLYGDIMNSKRLIRAYCYDCMGYYEDGISDCENVLCPLYQAHPYKKLYKSPVPSRGDSGIVRNKKYPKENRLYPITAIIKKISPKTIEAQITNRKLKPRKYPQETTQKQVTT
jgi:hypothetical protein